MSKGGVRDEEVWEEWIGFVVTSSRAELRRRLWFDETQDAQADAIPPRRRCFFVGLINFVIAVVEDDVVTDVVVVFVFVFWWFWFNVVERGLDEILGVELFRRAWPIVEVCLADGFWDGWFLAPQHWNGKERVVGEEKEVRDFEDRDDATFLSRSIRNGRIVAANNSDDDDDRVIEMTGGGGLLVTLVVDFYVNDDDNDDDDSDEEPRIGIHASNDKNNVACCWRVTHTRTGAFLSLLLLVAIEATACWWWCENERAMTMFLVAVAPNATLL